MTDGDLKTITTLAYFACHDKEDERPIKDVAVSGGVAYVTNGRIGLAAKLEGDYSDEVPDGFPLKALKGIIDGGIGLKRWHLIDLDDFRKLDKEFGEKVMHIMAESRADYEERYKAFDCPCCGKTLYWDNDAGEVVETRPERYIPGAFDVDKSTRLAFNDGTGIEINFHYLHFLVKAFGEGVIRYAVAQDEKGHDVLYLRSKDGSVHGALMPMTFDRSHQAEWTVRGITAEDMD